MENQHKKIKGYRDLSQEEIDLMNEIKFKANEVASLINKINDLYVDQEVGQSDMTQHVRFIQLAEDDLQMGFMCLTRSIALPESF